MRFKIIILTIILLSCRKDFKIQHEQQSSLAVVQSENYIPFVGDPSRTPDLAPISLAKDYWGNEIGVKSGGGYPFAFQGYSETNELNGTWLRYRCPIENIGVASANFYSPLLPYQNDTHFSGADFIYELHKDSSGVFHGITNPQFLYRAVFQNGLPVSLPADNYKISWEGLDLQNIYNYNPALNNQTILNYYGFGDTIVLHPMFFDEYQNDVKLPENPLGKYVVVITVNQEDYSTHQRLFRENDYSNNTVMLPVQVNGLGPATVDESALVENTPRPVDSLLASSSGKGKIRTVIVHWVCPYHKFVGVIHKFQIKKNGVIIGDNLWGDSFTDVAKIGTTYGVAIKIEGLGISPFKSVTVKR